MVLEEVGFSILQIVETTNSHDSCDDSYDRFPLLDPALLHLPLAAEQQVQQIGNTLKQNNQRIIELAPTSPIQPHMSRAPTTCKPIDQST